MKKIITLFVLVSMSYVLMAQSKHTPFQYAYRDAFEMRNLLFKDDVLSVSNAQKVVATFEKYHPDEEATAAVEAAIENPFLAPYLKNNKGTLEAAAQQVRAQSDGTRGTLAFAESATTGFSSPSTVLLGLADFLVKRTKQELNIAFFTEFQELMKQSQELQLLFPSVAEVLETIDEDVYQFKAFWEVLRESFITDMDDMLSNLQHYLQETDKIDDERVRMLLVDWFRVIEMFKDQTTPADVINYLGERAFLHQLNAEGDQTFTTLQQNLTLLGLFSRSLEQPQTEGYWISPSEMELLVRDTVMADLYLGLLYEQGKDLTMGEGTLGKHLLTLRKTNTRIRFFVRCISGFVQRGQGLVQIANRIKQNEINKRLGKTEVNTDAEYDDYYRFVEGTLELAEYTYAIKKELLGATDEQDVEVQKYISVLSDLNKLGLDIRKRRYTAAIISALFILEKMLPEGYECERQLLLKYGSFIATAATAKTPQEVSDAIEAFALPPGGSAIKKYSKFSIALNAYVGLSAGQENLQTVGSQAYYAVTAPLGVSFSWGFKRAGALSLFVSAIDVGALTAFRFQDDVTNELPDLRFENVLAPGGYLIYGVPKYPISLGIGAQLGPNLRSIDQAANLNIDKTSGWRWGVFLAVDLPMVSIHSSNKNYKVCKRKRSKKKTKKTANEEG